MTDSSAHRSGPIRGLKAHADRVIPALGVAGSRSAALHSDQLGPDRPWVGRVGTNDLKRFAFFRQIGTMGACLVALGGLGAGATPVVNNTFWENPLAAFMGRMFLTSTAMVFVGVGFMVLAWGAVGYFALRTTDTPADKWVNVPTMVRTYIAWVLPFSLTTPLFTQDIYSYIAQGTIAARGLDPYSGGPVDLLGVSDPLARSVPLVWSHSPSPYGPVAMTVAETISRLTDDNIVAAVFLHRLVSVVGLSLCAWALVKLSRRCGVKPAAALWLGVLNPLTILHLVGGIHNESLMMGLLLTGMELGLRSLDRWDRVDNRRRLERLAFMSAGTFMIACAGMVKVPAIVGLGFLGAALARRWGGQIRHLVAAAVVMSAFAGVWVLGVSQLSGLGIQWMFIQGGATDVLSWMSLTTILGLLAGFIGMALQLGDHTSSTLQFSHAIGVLIAMLWMVRMLFGAFRGRMPAVGAMGVGFFVLVIFFPVLHPWYVLWALLPLSAWANIPSFRNGVVAYSAVLSFFVIPRGLAIPAWNVVEAYVVAIIVFALAATVIIRGRQRWRRRLRIRRQASSTVDSH